MLHRSINFQISNQTRYIPNTFNRRQHLAYNPDPRNVRYIVLHASRQETGGDYERPPLRYYPGWPRLKILAATVCRGQSYLRFGHVAY